MNIFHFFMTDEGDVRIGNTVLFLLVFTLICGPLSYYGATAMGWITLPAKKLNVQNVEAQYTKFYTERETVRQDAANINNAKQQITEFLTANGSDSSKWTFAARSQYQQLTSIEGQQEIVYNNACATYQANWDNFFQTSFAQAPTDLPRTCPLIGGN